MKNNHGGDIYEYESVIDLSANINPLGMPENIKQSIVEVIDYLGPYPDYKCRKLTDKLSKKLECNKNNIVLGNGAADIIYSLIYYLKPKKAFIAVPTFIEYEEALKNVDCQIIYHNLSIENDFLVEDEYINSLELVDVDIAFLCTPNNPTGKVIEKKILKKTIEICKKKDIFLVIDESFIEFTDDNNNVIKYIQKFDNILILRSFTKMFAMAGIRLGYALCSNRYVIEGLVKARQTWSVSTIAQAAGMAALDCDDFVCISKKFVDLEKENIYKRFEKIGIKYIKSEANYVLFYYPDIRLKEIMLRYNILIRDCSNYKNLKNGFFRIAVKTHEDMDLFFRVLEMESEKK